MEENIVGKGEIARDDNVFKSRLQQTGQIPLLFGNSLRKLLHKLLRSVIISF